MRTRIAAVVAVLSALALAGAGLTVYLLQSHRIDEQANSAISLELAEFARLEQAGIDPTTGRSFSDGAGLMRAALESKVARDDIALIAFWDGVPQLGQGRQSTTLSGYGPLRTAVRERLETGGAFRLDTPLGPAVVAVQPVHSPTRAGALTVAYLLDPSRGELRALMRSYSLVAASALLIVTAGAWLVAGRLLRPLRALRETARDISHTDLSRRLEVAGNDDLGELALTFNAMLDRLESSFTVNREFLDDAGHDLRTPLTIVRGHLELVDPADPADVASTRTLVLHEVDRMSRMVDDLVVLSRADQPDFVRSSPIDGRALAREVLDKARGLGDRDWQLDGSTEGQVAADPQRITQALLQLCGNAVRHTEVGDEIAVGFRREAERAIWWVRDSGSGIPSDEQDHVFERFRRGRSSSDPNGSGLGLAIVAAIMRAHGGTVELSSAEGVGSLFTITVPELHR